ncbi:MAG: gliding motility protein GldL [Bacteroidales bacterium]|nr:gliding motility protein GldL [Bacteroidales bacterium]HPD95319.1 gliding motility protein GldL [Tenuifilaceae bacterium]HRX31573.1 gliding motility protein GldL [Tenuifilaceae bacterium]
MKINVEEIVTSKKWKNFMKFLYGWGASVVIIGALFKILHLKGAGGMLFAGMGTEAIIFFFSAFEPIHEELDWTLVYPELTGMTEEEEINGYRKNVRHSGIGPEEIQEIITGILASMPQGVPAPTTAVPQTTGKTSQPLETHVAPAGGGGGMNGALIFTEKFNKMLENAEISPALFDKVSVGLNKLGDASNKIADIANTTNTVKDFSDKLSKASEAVNSFNQNYSQNSQVLNDSMNTLSQSIQNTTGTMSQSGENFMAGVDQSVKNLEEELTNVGKQVSSRIMDSSENATGKLNSAADGLANAYQQTAEAVSLTYQKLAEAMQANGTTITNGSGNYKEQLEKLNKNMAALNAAHELHLQETTQRLKEAEKVYKGVDGMVKDLNSTIEETNKFKTAVETLNNNIAALNNVYGNMLTAINAISGK